MLLRLHYSSLLHLLSVIILMITSYVLLHENLSTAIDSMPIESITVLAEVALSKYNSADSDDKFISLDGGRNVYLLGDDDLLLLAYGLLSIALKKTPV